MLTEDQIDVIANDVRTKPLAEVGRHVMPLIHHILGLDMRQCSNCRHWVPWDNSNAHRGECLSPVGQSNLQIMDVGHATLVTPFDWFCKGYEAKQVDQSDDAQCSAGF